jgi:hypothetical protein
MIYYSLKEIKNFLSSDCKETYLLPDFTFEDALEEFNGIIQKDFSFAKTLIETFDFTGAKKKLLENFENIGDITEQGKENLKMFNEHKTKYKDKFKERGFTINKEYRDAFFSIFKNKDYIDHLLLVSEKLKEGEYQEIEYVNLYANIIKFENQISEILKTQCYPNAIKNENVLNQFTWNDSKTDLAELVYALTKTESIKSITTGKTATKEELLKYFSEQFAQDVTDQSLLTNSKRTYKKTKDLNTFTRKLADIVDTYLKK